MDTFTKNLSEPWFSLVAMGEKTVEARLVKGDFLHVAPGDVIVWSNEELGSKRTVKTVVESVKRYTSFEKLLRGETLARCLPAPGVTSIDRGRRVYRQIYSAGMERAHGVVAVRLLTRTPKR